MRAHVWRSHVDRCDKTVLPCFLQRYKPHPSERQRCRNSIFGTLAVLQLLDENFKLVPRLTKVAVLWPISLLASILVFEMLLVPSTFKIIRSHCSADFDIDTHCIHKFMNKKINSQCSVAVNSSRHFENNQPTSTQHKLPQARISRLAKFFVSSKHFLGGKPSNWMSV